MKILDKHSATFLEFLSEYNSTLSAIDSLEKDLELVSSEDIINIVKSKITQLKQDINTLENSKLYTETRCR